MPFKYYIKHLTFKNKVYLCFEIQKVTYLLLSSFSFEFFDVSREIKSRDFNKLREINESLFLAAIQFNFSDYKKITKNSWFIKVHIILFLLKCKNIDFKAHKKYIFVISKKYNVIIIN